MGCKASVHSSAEEIVLPSPNPAGAGAAAQAPPSAATGASEAATPRAPAATPAAAERKGPADAAPGGGSRLASLIGRRTPAAEPAAAAVPNANANANPKVLRPQGSAEDAIVTAKFEARIQKILEEHPYLEEGKSAQPHPLSMWIRRCREAAKNGKYREAEDSIRQVNDGLLAEARPVTEAFRRFDTDGSGNLDQSEFKHMCAYLGWGEEEADLLLADMDGDGKVTVWDFTRFVGHLGGVQRLFEKRRLRVTASRKDVCDFAGLSVGSRVRAHFYVSGQKSKNWKEAQVLAVGVERKSDFGPSTLGVLLEFGFGGRTAWRAKQVVPMSWVLSTVEDASVAAALREVGILDEQQGFWSLVLPDSEMQAVARLENCQRAALAFVRQQSSVSHEKALPGVRKRFESLGFGERELQAVLGWVQDLAPIVVHIHLDKVGVFMETDEYYRNQFETKTSCGALDSGNSIRTGWEHDLFGGCYDDAKPFDRCKYGALNVMNDYRGVVSARQYGDSCLVLKDARLRCTFAATDSGGIAGSRLGVLDKYAHVLAEYNDSEIRSLVEVSLAAIEAEKGNATHVPEASRVQLLRGSSEDPTTQWVTMGFPGLPQNTGRYYFEAHLRAGCVVPQVGMLTPDFAATPGAASAQGVGDDEYGWGVDGQNASRWHKGMAHAWSTLWESKPLPSGERGLCEDTVIGVAVDIDKQSMWYSLNGVWDETPTFGPDMVPEGVSLYPALSVKGRAGIALGPDYKHAPPTFDGGNFLRWPGGTGGVSRLDTPHLGNSEVLSIYKEVQIHGEMSLKRNVQRLVAASKYRQKPKNQRSYALSVTGGSAICNGTFQRVGAHDGRPLLRNAAGAVMYYDAKAQVWRMHDKEDFAAYLYTAPETTVGETPTRGWRVPDSLRGVLDAAVLKGAMEAKGLSAADVNKVLDPVTDKESHGMSGWFAGRSLAFKHLKGRSFEEEWQKLPNTPCTAEEVWEAAVEATGQHVLAEAGFPTGKVVESSHPYTAYDTWRKEVQIAGSHALSVYFASKTGTLDTGSNLRVYAGGLHRNAAGVGARVEVTPFGGDHKVWGTVVEGGAGGPQWKVLLDRRPAHPEAEPAEADDAKAPVEPVIGDRLEVKYMNGRYYWAKIADISVDDSGATKYTVDWEDGDTADRVHGFEDLRWDPQERAFPSVGSVCEAKFKDGHWYQATIESIATDEASGEPRYTVTWADGDTEDTEKTRVELRRKPKSPDHRRDVEDLPRYGGVVSGTGPCIVVAAEKPKVARAIYQATNICANGHALSRHATPAAPPAGADGAPGAAGADSGFFCDVCRKGQPCGATMYGCRSCNWDKCVECYSKGPEPRELGDEVSPDEVRLSEEISAFKLDRSCPIAPITIAGFSHNGPAQEAGAKVGWYLDLEESMKGPGKAALGQALDGIGGIAAFPGGGDGTSGPGRRIARRLLDAAYADVDELLKRLNGTLRKSASSKMELVFRDGATAKPVSLLPEAHVQYPHGQKVGSEITKFRLDGDKIQPDGFAHIGPAQRAGVRSDWVLDLVHTFGPLNPGKAPTLTREAALADPQKLVDLSDVTLVFHQFNPVKAQQFQGKGDAGPENWTCPDLPGDVAEFEFAADGDTSGEADKRWGVFALILSKDTPKPTAAQVDELATKWSESASKSVGLKEEPQVNRDGWDEERLRALCARHGWEFEWMTEDGERRKLANLLHGGDFGAGAEELQVMRRFRADTEDTLSNAGDSQVFPDGHVETAPPDPTVPASAGIESKGRALWRKLEMPPGS